MFVKRFAFSALVVFVALYLSGCGGSSAPVSVSVTASANTVDATNAVTVSAQVLHDKNGAGVSWSVSGGGTISGSTSSATYTAPAASKSALTVTVTATSIADATKSATANITVPAAPSITTSAMSAGTVGTAYSLTLAGSGGISPYKWMLAGGTLPTCLSLSSAGVLSSAAPPTASCAGTFSGITFKLTDSGTPNALTATSAAMTITITAPTLTFPTALAQATVGSAYTASVAATGALGTSTYSLASGTLPTGLTLNANTGAITGTPMASGVGASTFKATVTDSFGDTATSGTQNLTVAAAPAITFGSTNLADGAMTVAYTGTVAATGGAGTLTHTVSAGALPDGLQVSTSGAISGTPTKVGTFSFTAKAADAYGDSATQVYSLKINYPALTVTALTPPVGYLGSNYTATTLAATGGSGTGYTWAVSTGSALPAGLSISTAGVITGKPTASGATTTSVTVTDSASNTTTGSLAFTIKAGVSITTGTTLPTGYVGSAYSQTLAATGGSGSGYAWTVASGSTLPGGLILSPTGTLSGPPTTAAASSFTITVTDSASNTASATFSLTVSPGITIGAITLPKGYQGTAYPGATFTATGGSNSGFSWNWAAASGSTLPAGLNLSTGGAISGSPTVSGTFSIVVTVTDSVGNKTSQTVSLTVEATLSISSPGTLKPGTINLPYSTTLAATGGSGSYTSWTVTQGAASLQPLSLSLSSAGVLSGTPTVTGNATFTAQVTDSESHTATASLTVSVYSALTISTTNLPAGTVGTGYSQTLAAGGGTGIGYTWTATGSNLSTHGLSLSTTGVISGTPTNPGTASFTPTVTDSGNNTATASAPLTIFIYAALSLPNTNPASLPSTGTTGVAYTGSVTASGGSGSANYAWTITGMPSDGLSASTAGGTLTVVGTPTSPAPVTFTASVKDTVTNVSVGPYTYTITITNPAPMMFATTTTLPAGTVSNPYAQTISATGGVPPYTWAINGTNVPSTGAAQALASGLTVSSNGTLSLSIGGTPTATGPVTFTAKITDSLGSSAGPTTFTIQVNSAGSQVSGQIFLNSGCGGSTTVPPITVSINTTPVQTTQTDTYGNYSFASIPNGTTYTITPSITGASSVFYPATLTNVVVNNNPVTGENFSAQVAYTVSGTVTYSASGTPQTGQTYISVTGSCGGNGGPGTSITETTLTSGGAYTIRGVPPGSYTVQAWMDPLGQSVQNAIDPTGSASLTVTDADVSGSAVTMHDPTFATPTSNPTIQAIIPNAQGVLIEFKPSQNSNSVEDANGYLVEWSTSPTLGGGSGGAQFATIAGSHTFTASGNNGVWVLTNASLSGSGFSFASGQTYYFQARSFNTLDTANPHPSGWCNYTASGCSGTTSFTGVKIETPLCSGTCTIVSSSVTIPAAITIKAGAPLYLGLLQFSSSSGGDPIGIYVTEIASPSSGANDFTVTVPSGSNYAVLGILDQNNTGGFGAGAITNVRDKIQANLTISGSTQSVAGITLPTSNSTASVSTQFSSNSCQGCGSPSTSYQLSFNVSGEDKLPVAVVLNSGPNLLNNNGTVALDMSLCSNCGNAQFGYSVSLLGTPNVGDTYGFTVTYSDGTQDTGTTVTGAVMGWNGGSTVVGASDAPSALAPVDNNSTSPTPTFSWTDSSNSTGANVYYSFYIYQNTGCSGTCNIWQIPGNNSKSNGFSNSTTSITWGTDPTGGGSTPSVGSLTSGDVYNWSIQAQDSNGNSAQTSVWYQP